MGALTLDASIAKRVDKVGGGGYGLSIWVDGLGRFLERASALRIRTIADQVVSDHRIVQLKPGELGLLVELDEIPDATQWFWDDIEAEISVDPVIDDILAGEISSRDPEAQAEQWATLFDVSVQRIDVPQIVSRVVCFVRGDVKMMTGIDVQVADGIEPDARELTLSGVTFTLV